MSDLNLDRFPALAASRRFALDVERRARDALAVRHGTMPGIATVAFCGSLGRLEAGPGSDVDCIVVSERGSAGEGSLSGSVFDALGLKRSKPWGIYRRPVAVEALLDARALGSLEEPADIYGKRMQLLLDARPVHAPERFATLQREVVDWYGTGFLERAPNRGWTYLINDVMRYLHAYAAWQQYKFGRTDDDSWFLRQAKFRSTRVATIAALLLLIGESSAMADKRAWLSAQLHLTPLERLHAVMTRYDAAAFDRLLAAYARCHAWLADSECRAALIAAGPDGPPGAASDGPAVFEDLRRESAIIMRVLTAFVLDRRHDWDERFFERVLF